MPVVVKPGYVEQNLPDKYIKAQVLKDFINDHLDEFGPDWAWTSLRGHHTVWIKRLLTEDEIQCIAITSHGDSIAANEEFED